MATLKKKESHMPIFKATAGGLAIPDGMYAATAMGVEDREPGPNSQTTEPWWCWNLILQSGPKRGAEISAGSSQRTGPGSKSRRWVEALLGRELEEDEEFELDSIFPRDCQVLVRKNARGFASVQDILPVQADTPSAPVPPKPLKGGPSPKPPTGAAPLADPADDIPF
jgi:hypothetical protein